MADFKALVQRAEGDTTLRQQLQTLLKLPREKWDDAVAQAKGAVFPDSRRRAWFADRAGSLGLLYTATLGEVDLKRPEGKGWGVCWCLVGSQGQAAATTIHAESLGNQQAKAWPAVVASAFHHRGFAELACVCSGAVALGPSAI